MKMEELQASISRKESNKTAKENIVKFKVVQVLPWPGDGWYLGTIRNVKEFDESLMLEVDICDLHDSEKYYGPKKGWLRPHTTGNDITSWFFDAFGNPTDPKDTIGKDCAVYVKRQYSKSRNQHFENVVGFAELPADDAAEEKTKKAK